MNERNNIATGRNDDSSFTEETQWQQVAQRFYDVDRDGGLTTTIVFAIAEAKDVSPTALKSPPLYEVVDVAGIEAAFFGRSEGDASRTGTGAVEFQYTDYLITVKSDGWVQVYETVGKGSA